MRLISATVRNYRVHRDARVDFDKARTVIGGPNEIGKSTLVEAIHHGLFLKATVTGEALESMESTLHQGRPEVEIRFEARGAEYEVAKRYAGQSGTTRLTQMGGQTWQGEEAQSRLEGLLGVESAGGGKGILNRVSEQWAHLWVWQGESGKDPARHVASQQAALVQQLQQVGGAVAMQSEADSRVASLFSQKRSQIFAKAGGPLRNSELFQAQAEVRQAEEAHAAASERLGRLRQAVEDHEGASSTIQRTVSDLEAIDRQHRAVKEKLTEVDRLRGVEKEQSSACAVRAERLAALEGIEKNIAGLRVSIEGLQESLEPMEEQLARLEDGLAGIRKRNAEADQTYDGALEKTRNARLMKELAAAYAVRFEKEARCAEVKTRLELVQGLRSQLDDIQGQIAQLVPIDEDGLGELQSLENRLAQSSAALSAMATGVEVVSADRPVRVGEVELSVGESRTVSGLTDVTVADKLVLRIHPGGGDSLLRANEEVRTLQVELRRLLDGYGLDSTAKAAEMVARRAELRSEANRAEAALGQWPGDQAEQYRVVQGELAAATADVQRRLEQADDAEQPTTLSDARAWLGREEDALRAAESGETGLRATRDTLRSQLTDLENRLNSLREVIGGERQMLAGFSAQLDLLIGSHGPDELRACALSECQDTKAELEAELSRTRSFLEALQPELLEADRERLQRAWEEADRQRQDAETKRAVAQAALRSDGADDPSAVLAQAEARLEAATEHQRAVSRKANAIALVDDLFQQEQRALADQFSLPLAQKISAYLQRLFGPEARAVVRFEDNTFMGVELVRSTQAGAMSFVSLSEGAREQVAAAIRLATAELLAVDHDGSLPVVFDDAFAYSDPERVNTLQRMLDLGASRGLQIIVLSCNPSDYAALGAREVALR
jgi:DNA repair exonuclease SbcCD ATPase subunit